MLQISISFEEFQLVLQFCTIFHFTTIFFNSSKIEVSKNLGGCGPPSPPGFYEPAIEYENPLKIQVRIAPKKICSSVISI